MKKRFECFMSNCFKSSNFLLKFENNKCYLWEARVLNIFIEQDSPTTISFLSRQVLSSLPFPTVFSEY